MTSADNKTESVRTKIFKAILYGDFSPGDKLPTEREMAERTSTSRVTVRRAYEQLEQSGILLREQGRGTFVRCHSGGNPKAGDQIALLTSVSDPFALEFIRAVEKELSNVDMLLVLKITDETPDREEEAAIDLVGKGINNLIIWPSGNGFPVSTFERLRVLGANMVFFDRMLPGTYADYVGLDNDDAMKKLFAYASEHSLKNPVFVTHSDLQADSDKMREQAFLKYCEVNGLEGNTVRISRYGCIDELPKEIKPDSTVFCVNDAMAIKLKPYLNKQLVLGIDGLPGTQLVTCKQPMGSLAANAVKALIRQQRSENKWKSTVKLIKGKLINE